MCIAERPCLRPPIVPMTAKAGPVAQELISCHERPSMQMMQCHGGHLLSVPQLQGLSCHSRVLQCQTAALSVPSKCFGDCTSNLGLLLEYPHGVGCPCCLCTQVGDLGAQPARNLHVISLALLHQRCCCFLHTRWQVLVQLKLVLVQQSVSKQPHTAGRHTCIVQHDIGLCRQAEYPEQMDCTISVQVML